MTPERGTGVNYLEQGKGSPVQGVVEPGALIAHPMNVKGVALAPQDSGRESVPNGGLDDEEWITVFGYENCLCFALLLLSFKNSF